MCSLPGGTDDIESSASSTDGILPSASGAALSTCNDSVTSRPIPVVFTAGVPNPCFDSNSEETAQDSPYYVIITGNSVKKISPEALLGKSISEEMANGNLDEVNFDQNATTKSADNRTSGAETDIERLQRNDLVNDMDENSNLDSSLGEENLLAHISRQVDIQQQLLSSAMDNTPHQENSHCEKAGHSYKASGSDGVNTSSNLSDHYSILPSLLNQPNPQMSWIQSSQNLTPVGGTPSNTTTTTGRVQTTSTGSTSAPLPGSIIYQQPRGSFVTSTPVGGQRVIQLANQDHCLFTPHPKTGQLLYLAPTDGSSPQLFQHLTPNTSFTSATNTSAFVTPNMMDSNRAMLLNSSGEDEDSSNNCSSDAPPTPLDSSNERDSMQFEMSLFNSTGEESREQHNMKERKRRARIKDACDVMRKLVPGMSDKTDKATVFEFGARYIHFLKAFVGNKHDKDFLVKYSPY